MNVLTRRTLLEGALGAGLVAATPGWARKRETVLAGGAFAQGVASGIPALHGATLWTRVDGLERAGFVVLEIARDAGFAHVVERRRMRVAPRNDGTGRVHVGGLPAGEQFFYRFHTRATESPVGRFRTRRPPDSAEPVRVAFFSCQNWQTGYFTGHAGLALEDLDLAVCVGDFIYEAASDPGPREDKIGPDQSAQTLDEYREKYRMYRSDPNLQALQAAHNYAFCWDDHEVESSYYDEHPGNAQGREARVPFPARRANGYRAFFEHMPVIRVRGDRDRIYRRIALGAHADLILTDLHQYAAPPPCEGAPSEGPVILVPCDEAKDPKRSLLGARQRAWLEQALIGSSAAWKLWGTSMMLMALDNAPGQPFTVGEWSGWEGERNSLAASLRAKGLKDLAAFSGDIHTFFAGQWTESGRTGSPPVGVEFVSGSMTSSGIAESFGNQGTFTDQVRDINPHISYANTSRRGYAVAEASDAELKVTFRSPQTVKSQPSPVEDLAKFTVARGSNTVEQA